ncbi:undecaprenyl-diphosphate phosphatase [Celerinatantimonas diazotrophica]|uniref:Undecaprenyl-diphosphatase n=1 Tax=Celerinatantimonas diazotrophica TaxID=412034 RepID=A0A4V2PNF2_9GAMM|nr:undecaprenyl-diphosphate phosphatase [Celerinatantimonas diazotrophica]TCK46871.1 undecaprenyl-diphosphatase [Celerinatantimonas diazotrophica]CAG9295638.1 Undecaprenyl-diphosphatase [Celerinatantimonas diazotrophica]
MHIVQILILAIVQGIAELLPVSSSAHVILAEKLMGLDPTAPAMTLLLVMLHTGTMFAVIVYFWKSWKKTYFQSTQQFFLNLSRLIIATFATGVIGLAFLLGAKKLMAHSSPHFEIEQLFGNLHLIAASLAAVGVLIIISSLKQKHQHNDISATHSLIIGIVQGLCLPFRGFSRSGATISTSLLLGVNRQRAEEFSFALAVILTPVVIAKEGYRIFKYDSSAVAAGTHHLSISLGHAFGMGLLGMVFSFLAGLAAMRWLSSWLENGRWHWFGCYCIVVSALVFTFS